MVATRHTKLLGVDFQREIAKGLGKLLLPATLTKVTTRERSTALPLHGTRATSTDYKASGIVSRYDESEIDGTLILRTDRKVLLLAGTIDGYVVPEPGDRVTIQGATYTVEDVGSDPANATYTLQARGV